MRLISERDSTERQMSVRQEMAAKIQQSIWSMLGEYAPEGPTPELAECLQTARAQITLADQAQGQRNTLEQHLTEGKRSLLTLQGSARLAQDAWDTWNRSWQDAVQAAGYDVAILADQVESEITAMQEIERLLARIRIIRSERIDTMQADLNGLAESAKKLTQKTASELEMLPAEDIALELARRLEQAKQAATTAAELQSRLARTNALA